MITSVWPLVAWRWPCLCDVCACVGADLVLVRIAIVGREPIARSWSVAAWVGPWLARGSCISTKAHEGLYGRITSRRAALKMVVLCTTLDDKPSTPIQFLLLRSDVCLSLGFQLPGFAV